MGRTLPNLSNNIPFEAVPKAFAVEVPIGMKSIYMADPRWKVGAMLEATPVYEYVSLHREEVFLWPRVFLSICPMLKLLFSVAIV